MELRCTRDSIRLTLASTLQVVWGVTRTAKMVELCYALAVHSAVFAAGRPTQSCVSTGYYSARHRPQRTFLSCKWGILVLCTARRRTQTRPWPLDYLMARTAERDRAIRIR